MDQYLLRRSMDRLLDQINYEGAMEAIAAQNLRKSRDKRDGQQRQQSLPTRTYNDEFKRFHEYMTMEHDTIINKKKMSKNKKKKRKRKIMAILKMKLQENKDKNEIKIGDIGTYHVGSDSYGFKVTAIVARFKSGERKGKPKEIEIMKTSGVKCLLTYRRTGVWYAKKEKIHNSKRYDFGYYQDNLDPGF